MSGSTPLPLDGGEDDAVPHSRPVRTWVWLLVGVVAVALVTLLVAQPWSPIETEPTATSSVSDTPTATATPTPTPSVSIAPPGATAVFDALTAPGLFVTTADLLADVPAAEPAIAPQVLAGELAWGLPAGSTIDPATCTLAVTVVATPPVWFDARSWSNTAMDFQQEVVLLADPAAARAAFRELVTTVDACPSYQQTDSGIPGSTWTAQPAIEGQGVYPSIVLHVVRTTGSASVPAYVGHMLVGNTIVTWTAFALATGGTDAALATLGDAASLSAMVQDRAQLAVRALG